MTTTINIDHPLFNTRHEALRIQAVLRHIGSGADLRDFTASPSEKVALVKAANQRGLIAWHKARGRYELTPAGWCELAPSRRFGVGSLMVGMTAGATLGAAALAVFWFTAGAAHKPATPRPVVAMAPAQPAKAASAPVVTAASSTASIATTSTSAAPSTPAPAAPSPAVTAAAPAAPPAAAPVEPEATTVAEGPTPEQLAEAAKAKRAAAKKEKARQRAAARRKREEAARAWAGDPWRTRQAEYSGHGVYGYGGGYGGQNSWFAYR